MVDNMNTTAETDQQSKPGNRVIEVDNVTFSYDTVPVLENVTISVDEKQLLYIIGPNGGGKTTLLRLLLGLLHPDKGTITVFGKQPEHSRHRMGYIPQYQQFDPKFPVTVFEVVLMGRLGNGFGFYTKKDRSIASSCLEKVGLFGLQDRSFTDLSGGQRQRVLIARALASEPELLILDEPMASVDVSVRDKLSTILSQLNQEMTILLTTHDFGFVNESVKGVVCVNRKVVFHPTNTIDGDAIRQTYGSQMNLIRHDLFCSNEDLHHG